MRKSLIICLAVGSLFIPNLSFGWGAAGHQVIAAEAYRELPPQLQAQAFEVLKAHPNFAKWTNAYQPNANFDLATYVFMRSSTWPDEIRRKGNAYDHPNWHFVDYPLRPPSFPLEPGPKPADDVLFGIAQSEKYLSDANASAEIRAVYLAWLIHLIGDLHQPLHCASYYTADYPNGDKGGNDFFVRPNRAGVRLHSVWDGLLGSAANPRTQYNYAIELASKFPRESLSELKKDVTPKAWSLESREDAINNGYLRGALKGGLTADAAVALPSDYTKAAKAVAERQAALAGFRLADEIEANLKWSAPVALLASNSITGIKTNIASKIGAVEASKHYDQLMTVTGKVAQVTIRPTVTFVNLDQAGPGSPFTAVIFPQNLSQFGDLTSLKGQKVEITGTIVEYHHKPEIILDSTNQLNVVGP